MKLDKSKLDVSQIFLVYMATVGDVVKTAQALDMSPELVQALAENEGWIAKVRRISVMSKSERPGDWERAQNRALCFVQAHSIRRLIDRMVKELLRMSDEKLVEHTSVRQDNNLMRPSAQCFGQLAKAAQTCHEMSYAALGDTMAERQEAQDEDGTRLSPAQLHAAVVSALSHPSLQGKEPELLVEEAEKALVVEAPTVQMDQSQRPPFVVPILTERKSLPAIDAMDG